MESKRTNMQALFDKLTEKNKDLVILLAQSVHYAQKTNAQQLHMPTENRTA